MSRKVVETMKAPDGRFVWQIGEVDDMGGGFGCLFIDKQSGDWTRKGEEITYSGKFFPTRDAANADGRLEISRK